MSEKWSALKLAYTREQRTRIMMCIQRLNGYEKRAIDRATVSSSESGNTPLPNYHLRQRIRRWYRSYWEQLLHEYELVLPHVSELPDD